MKGVVSLFLYYLIHENIDTVKERSYANRRSKFTSAKIKESNKEGSSGNISRYAPRYLYYKVAYRDLCSKAANGGDPAVEGRDDVFFIVLTNFLLFPFVRGGDYYVVLQD